MRYNPPNPALLMLACVGFLSGVAPDASAYDLNRALVSVHTPGDGFLALRSEPSAKTGVRLAKIPDGTQLTLGTCIANQNGGNWCQTRFAGFSGWVMDRYVLRDHPAVPPSGPALDRPVMVGGDPEEDACGSLGVVSGLNPAGDGFLALRAAPGTQAKLLHKLQEGDAVYVCDEAPGWLGVVVSPSNPLINCEVSSPIIPRQPYPGQCKKGWVSSKLIEIDAG